MDTTVFHDDVDPPRGRSTRIAVSAVAFAEFVAGCLVLAYSSNLGEAAVGVVLECLSGFLIAVVRDRH
jgi:hypothetical protein